MTRLPSTKQLFQPMMTGLLALVLMACADKEPPTAAAPPQAPPPPGVDVITVQSQKIQEQKEYTARLVASKEIVVRPRTSGYIVEVGVEDGARVKKGDLMFQVDFRTIRADVERLVAELERAKAEIELAERDLKRANSLRTTNAISQEQLDNRRTELTQARALSASVAAELKRTRVLDAITSVKAEFDGQISDARVEVGSSVVAGETVLTTLVSTQEVQASFDVDEPTYLKLQAMGFDYENTEIKTHMGLVNQQGFPYQGRVDFVDNQLDTETGTIRMRAVYDNGHGELTPGLFARVRLDIGEVYQAVMVPEKAIATDLSSKYVLVIGENNIVQFRPIQLGARKGELREVKSGLEPGEVIIVSGLQRAFPGAPVTPNNVDAESNVDSAGAQ